MVFLALSDLVEGSAVLDVRENRLSEASYLV